MSAPLAVRYSALALLISLFTAAAATFASSPAHADQHEADGAVVRATNSFSVDGGAEEIFIGPSSSVIRSGNEFTGFGGFDIDIRSNGIFMQWSADPQFDDFEGEFEGSFRDFFLFEFDDATIDNVVVESSANLVPDVLVVGNTIRVTFSDGMVYGDGQLAVIRAEITRTSGSTVADPGGAVISRQIATESAPTISNSGIRPSNAYVRPNPVIADGSAPPSVPDTGNVAATPAPTATLPNQTVQAPTATAATQTSVSASGVELAATGTTTDVLASGAIMMIVAGAAVITTSRRRTMGQVRHRSTR